MAKALSVQQDALRVLRGLQPERYHEQGLGADQRWQRLEDQSRIAKSALPFRPGAELVAQLQPTWPSNCR